VTTDERAMSGPEDEGKDGPVRGVSPKALRQSTLFLEGKRGQIIAEEGGTL